MPRITRGAAEYLLISQEVNDRRFMKSVTNYKKTDPVLWLVLDFPKQMKSTLVQVLAFIKFLKQ